MDRRLVAAVLAALPFAACSAESPAATTPAAESADAIQTPALAPVPPLDYATPAGWLCRPETQDACEQVATATIVSADGALAKEPAPPHAEPAIDCFYVYPTVSHDPSGNADATP